MGMETISTGRIVELGDGTRALIRPIEPDDRDRLREGFESASAESIFLRFLTPYTSLTSGQLDYLTNVDHEHHEALIAVDPETGTSFGTARYIRYEHQPGMAEFAIGVGDRWMRIGLGTALFEALIGRAREDGVVRLVGLTHPENEAIRRLVDKVAGGYESGPISQGAVEIRIDLS
jgi:RimJ/RimL family protein N-acetyltransferase